MLRIVGGVFVISLLFVAGSQEDVHEKFSCNGRSTGYYADVVSGCQIYHMCDGLGRQFSYSCPNTTLFQQRMLICDHWYMVNCSRSENDYTANLLIGQNKPFVEDSNDLMIHRTARPDLLSEPTASEINLIYRTGRAQNRTDLNLVGVNSDFDQNNGSSIVTDKPAYHLPSHWSTEYVKPTPPTVNTPETFNVKEFVNTNNEDKERVSPQSTEAFVPIPVAKAINFNSNNLDNAIKLKLTNSFAKKDFPVNFKSSFKATTPVFPTKNELVTTEAPVDDILNAPKSSNNVDFNSVNRVGIPVNFNSLFQATTPVFPTKEELGTTEVPLSDLLKPPRSRNDLDNESIVKQEEAVVNFKSLFKATTPVYPTKQELGTTEAPVDDILQPPSSGVDLLQSQRPSLLFQAPNSEGKDADGQNANIDEENKYTTIKSIIKGKSKLSNEKVLKELRKTFSIPDYEFPLDTITRPGYDHSVDSLHANPFLADLIPRQHAS